MKIPTQKVAFVVGMLLTSALPVRAVDYTWTNTADQSSGYWTNGVLWGNLVGDYPGSAGGANTRLTNNVSVAGGSYTNILNLTPAAALSSLVISNGNGGEAWLIVTNNPAGTGVTLTTPLVLGSGGRLQIDNKGTVNIGGSAFNWLGTNGAIWLNNGGNLVTTGARTIGAGGSVTGLVTSASGAGNGGVWNFSAGTGALTIGGTSGHDNLIRVTDGAAFSNIVNLTMSGNRNSLIVTNGGQLLGSGEIIFNSAGYGNTITMGGGTWTYGGSGFLFIGGGLATGANSSNNTFNLVGGTVSNVTSLYVGTVPTANGSGASGNSFIVTNGGRFFMNMGGLGIGGFSTFVGGGNNNVILSNSFLGVGGASMVGRGSSNNTLTLLQDTLVDHRNTLMQIGFDAAVGNVVTVNGAIVTNISNLTVGSGAGNVNSGNALIVTNGGQLRINNTVTFGTGGSSNNTLIIDGGPQALASSTLFSNVGNFVIGTLGSGYNSVIVTNAILATGEVTIGNSTSNNTVTILADATWNLRGFNLRVGLGATTGNVVTVNGGILTNVTAINLGGTNNSLIVHNGGKLFGAGNILFNAAGYGNTVTMGDGVWDGVVNNLNVGNGVNSSNNAFHLTGGLVTNVLQLLVGGANGADFNSVTVTGGSLLMTNRTSSHVFVGSANGGSGGSYNTVTVSNSLLSSGGDTIDYVGFNSSSNRVTLLDSTWRMSRTVDGVVIGNGAATGNVVTVNDSIITNSGTPGPSLVIGSGINSVGNALIVTNDSRLFIGNGGLIVGTGGSRSNLFKIDGGSSSGVFVTNSSGAGALLTIGAAGSGFNSMTVTNARIFTAGVITIGTGSSNNTATLLGDVTWNLGANTLTIGTGAATGNVLTVNGSTVTNIGNGGLQVGATVGANFNSLIVTNGGRLYQNAGVFVVGATSTGGAGGGGNTVILSNSALTTSTSYIGSGSSNNTVTLLDTMWNASAQALTVGGNGNGGTGNVLTVNGSTVTNAGVLTIGSGAGNVNYGNSVIVTNGSRLFISSLTVGTGGSSNNTFRIDGGASSGAFVTNSGGFTIGNTGSAYNSLIVTNARLFTGGGNLGLQSSNNTVTILADATWNLRGGDLNIGNSSGGNGNVLTVNGGVITNVNVAAIAFTTAGNSLFITNGGLFAANTLTVGNGNADNRVLVTDGGVLQVNTLTFFSNPGNNTISNRNATYQFTAAPAITPMGVNIIAITDGTISFRTTSAANVATNYRIVFAGTNTFTLNNASNTAVVAGVNQTYTFNAIAGNPTNYARLVMVNGTTAYGNANGANLTIGTAGSMLVSNTTATISGLFTNLGSLRLVNSTANFASNFFQSATSTAFIDNNSTLAASAVILTNTGTIDLQGGTLVLKDLRNQGHLIATGGGLISNALINDVGAYIDVVSGTLTDTPDLINFGIITNNATFQIGSTGNGTVTNSGVLVLNSATFLSGQITNTGVVRGNGTVSGPVLNTGTVAGTNGTLTLLGAATGTGAYRAEAGGTLAFQGGGSISSLWNTGGTVRVASTVTNTGSLFVNAGTLVVAGASYVNNGGLYNLSGGVVTANAARVTVGGVLTNDGTLTFLHSVGTFNSAVVNRGAWITDPSTNVFLDSHTVTTNGYLGASTGDVFVFHAGLHNQSTNNVLWQTLNVTPGTNTVGGGTLFEFAGTSVTQTQVFYHPGLLLTGGFSPGPVANSNGVQDVTNFGDVTGFEANFALGQLWLTNTTLVLTQTVAGVGTRALFVNDLFLLDASNTRLVIGDNMRLYFVNSNAWDMANITLLGSGEIHQLNSLNGMVIVIPEPNVLLLCLVGFVTMYLVRRRPARVS